MVQLETPKGLNIHPMVHKDPTSLEKVQVQSKASAMSEAEMGQREAGRPSPGLPA